MSALETHGTIDGLLAGESGLCLGELFSQAQIQPVREIFVRLLGKDVVASFEATTAAAAPAEAEAKPEKAEVKAEGAQSAPGAAKTDKEKRESVVGEKRKARMGMVDQIKLNETLEREASKDPVKRSKRATTSEVEVAD